MSKKNVAFLVIVIIIGISLFLTEVSILAVFARQDNRVHRLQVLDKKGNVVHETDGRTLSDFNKYYFEKTFGPLEQYDVKLVTEDVPFPFRTWVVTAVGIPILLVTAVGILILLSAAVGSPFLLFFFVFRAYYGEEKDEKQRKIEPRTGVEKFVTSINRFNTIIFVIGFIGFMVFLVIIHYWIIPNLDILIKNGL